MDSPDSVKSGSYSSSPDQSMASQDSVKSSSPMDSRKLVNSELSSPDQSMASQDSVKSNSPSPMDSRNLANSDSPSPPLKSDPSSESSFDSTNIYNLPFYLRSLSCLDGELGEKRSASGSQSKNKSDEESSTAESVVRMIKIKIGVLKMKKQEGQEESEKEEKDFTEGLFSSIKDSRVVFETVKLDEVEDFINMIGKVEMFMVEEQSLPQQEVIDYINQWQSIRVIVFSENPRRDEEWLYKQANSVRFKGMTYKAFADLLKLLRREALLKHEAHMKVLDISSKPSSETIPSFRKEGNDLHITIVITLVQALLGFEKALYLDGGYLVDISSKGVTKPKQVKQFECEKGDVYVSFDVLFPDFLTEEQKRKIEEVGLF